MKSGRLFFVVVVLVVHFLQRRFASFGDRFVSCYRRSESSPARTHKKKKTIIKSSFLSARLSLSLSVGLVVVVVVVFSLHLLLHLQLNQ